MAETAPAGPAPARRLYDKGFEGWDHSPGCYATAYLVMAVGLLCGLGVWARWQGDRGTKFQLFAQFISFAVLEGTAYGFGGISHHLLDTLWDNGQTMGRTWGSPSTLWMYSWTLFMAIVPLADAFSTGVCLACAGAAESLFKVMHIVAFVVALVEVFLCATNQFEETGSVASLWGILTSLFGAVMLVKAYKNFKERGPLLILVGMLLRMLGFGFLIFTPNGCRNTGILRQNCPYFEAFDHNAWFHCHIAASILLIYVGVLMKNAKDQEEAAYFDMLQTREASPPKADRRCGCLHAAAEA